MIAGTKRRVAAAVIAATVMAGIEAGRAAESFRIKPMDNAPSATDGSVRRTIQPFDGWTLVCDEQVKRRTKVCNISQVVVDDAGETAFSWSLAATSRGAPVMIVRVPRPSAGARWVTVRLEGAAKSRQVELSACNDAMCLGYWEIDPELGRILRKGPEAELILTRNGRFSTIKVATAGLSAALRSLRER